MSPGPPQPNLKPPGAKISARGQTAREKSKRFLVWSVALLLLLMALIVLIFLPAKVKQVEQAQSVPVNTTVVTSLPRPTTAGVSQHDAGLALQAFLRLRAQPNLQDAELWAPQIWSKAMSAADLGDEQYGHRRFKEAQSAYEAASQLLIQLQADRPQILAETHAFGETLLRENRAGPAISAFERVLIMQADHREAQAGLAKARVRMQVLDLMKNGQQAETNDKPSLAAEAYTSALQLDSSYQPAKSALQTVNETLARQAYQDAISEALNYLESGKLKAADKALDIAATINPGTPELRDARRRLHRARQQSELSSLRRQVQAQVEKENWAGAIGLYQRALGIDSQATFARSGLQHANARLKLNAQLDHYLKAPERLSADEPLNNANTLLAANPGSATDEPLLAEKLIALGEAVRLATQPITLLIKSDNLTQVTIYHVGRLGAFEQKQISLRPGRYTVTGSRLGYRDVRKVISVVPASPASISIRCEERI